MVSSERVVEGGVGTRGGRGEADLGAAMSYTLTIEDEDGVPLNWWRGDLPTLVGMAAYLQTLHHYREPILITITSSESAEQARRRVGQ